VPRPIPSFDSLRRVYTRSKLLHPFIGRVELIDRAAQNSLSEEVELPPQLQEQLARLQQLQQTLQAVTSQKQQLEIELSETDRALAELDKITDQTPVYKSVGSLLLKSERPTVLSELKERKELLGTRITVLGRQEERTKERMKELQTKLQEKLRPASPAAN